MRTSLDDKRPPTFTAAIRWRGPDPLVDLETRHPGFRNPEEASRFADGSTGNSPQRLRLRAHGVLLVLGTGDWVDYPYDLFTVWVRRQSDAGTYEPHPFSQLTGYPSALGDYRRAGYAVLGPGGSCISLVIDFDNADRLTIKVEKKGGSDASQAARTPEAS
jgi:hypothetical protein